jgi:amino acid adenylation domain-containing protein
VVEALHPVRDVGRHPLFHVMFALQNAPMPALELSGLTLRPLEIDTGVAKFDLTLNLEEGADGLHGWFEYNTDLFDAATIARMAGHFQTLLAGIVDGPDAAIGQLPLLSPAERHRLLVEWNATASSYPRQCGIHDLVAAQAARTPEAEALIAADACLTYRELDQRANQLAHHLRALGVGPDVRVAINLPRSAALIVSLLGILKAGGAYVPLDPSYPAERLAFMLQDAKAPLLLTAPSALGIGLPSEALQLVRVVDLEADGPRIAQQPTTPPASGVAADNLAYVLYTSGSTGVPKGVAVPHRAVNRLVCNTNYVRLDSTDCVAQLSNCAFDAATFEIWGALVHGARLIILATDIILAPHEFATHLARHGITVLFLTTALFNQLARAVPSAFRQVRSLLIGGEAADPQWLAEVLKHGPPRRLLNVYGPTETTTFATWYLVEEGPEGLTTIPIGRPIANTQLYVLDRHLQPVPIGIAGELYIAGDGLAQGYLNRPALTAERFIVAPESLAQTTRLYRTGDMVRYLPDGNLEFLGRLDNQVKIRGFRIELGELEALLRQHPSVLESAVVMHEETPGDKRLVAYVAWNPRSDGGKPSCASDADGSTHRQWTTMLREYLRQQVPEYMVPSAFVIVDALPLTPNGKVDRRALPPLEMTHDELEASFVGPRNPMEQALAAIWARVLRCEEVGIHHNFFDLGGHSLLATEVIAAVRDTLGVEVPLRHLFENPTVVGLAEAIEQIQRSGQGLQRPSIVPVSREAHRVKLSELTSRAARL